MQEGSHASEEVANRAAAKGTAYPFILDGWVGRVDGISGLRIDSQIELSVLFSLKRVVTSQRLVDCLRRCWLIAGER